jgi:cell division protein FtsQ
MATAKEKVPSSKTNWSFWLGFTFFLLVVVSLLVISWFLTNKMIAERSTPVTSLQITGEMPYTQKQEVLDILAQGDLGNFFKLDVNEVQTRVLALPWVYSVSVRKHWPNELKIYVVDQTPVALWNGDFLINAHGVAFQADTSRLTSAIPEFFAPEGSETVALKNFRNLNKLLKFSGLSIDELMLSERFAWQLTLSDGVLLNLGREDTVDRVQRFMDIYPQIKKNKVKEQQVDYIDLRYDTGVAVGWKQATDKQRA